MSIQTWWSRSDVQTHAMMDFLAQIHPRKARVDDYANINATSHLKVDLSGTFSAMLSNTTLSGVSNFLAGGDPAIVALTINQLGQAAVTTATPAVNPHHHQGVADSGFFYADVVNRPLRLSMENVGDGDVP